MAKLRVTLTGRAPVRIDIDDWPVIAAASACSGRHECQANTTASITVRQHADGRALVYGERESGPGGWPAEAEPWYGGALVPAGGDIAAAILRLDGLDGGFCAIDADSLRRAAIADLPAEDI